MVHNLLISDFVNHANLATLQKNGHENQLYG